MNYFVRRHQMKADMFSIIKLCSTVDLETYYKICSLYKEFMWKDVNNIL